MREKVGNRWKEQGIVFCNRYGGYIEVSNLHVAFKQLLESAGLPDIRFHDLRHSVASILLSMEVNPKVVQELYSFREKMICSCEATGLLANCIVQLTYHSFPETVLLGHSHISITIAIYSHLFPSMQKKAINRLDDLFNGDAKE